MGGELKNFMSELSDRQLFFVSFHKLKLYTCSLKVVMKKTAALEREPIIKVLLMLFVFLMWHTANLEILFCRHFTYN